MSRDNFGKEPKFCTHCGAVSVPQIATVKEGSVLVFLLLLILGVLPGVLYYVFAMRTERFWVCGVCGKHGDMIPTDSPVARMALESAAGPQGRTSGGSG